jgi:hypothetical protein
MDKLIIQAKNNFPYTHLDPQTGILEFKGKSSPENAHEFYEPILNWLKEYSKKPAKITVLEIYLNYFNTASSKNIFYMLRIMQSIAESGNTVKIKWMYDKNDSDLLEAGEDYSQIVEAPFEFISLDKNNTP